MSDPAVRSVLRLSPAPHVVSLAASGEPSPFPVTAPCCTRCGARMEAYDPGDKGARWCGAWFRCPDICRVEVLIPSAALLAQHVEMMGAEAVIRRGYVHEVTA